MRTFYFVTRIAALVLSSISVFLAYWIWAFLIGDSMPAGVDLITNEYGGFYILDWLIVGILVGFAILMPALFSSKLEWRDQLASVPMLIGNMLALKFWVHTELGGGNLYLGTIIITFMFLLNLATTIYSPSGRDEGKVLPDDSEVDIGQPETEYGEGWELGDSPIGKR